MTKPSIVLFHGAWHCGAHFDNIKSALESYGYECAAPDLPSVGAIPALPNLDANVATARATVEEFTKAGKDVVVVGHSFGGFVTTQSLEGLGKKEGSTGGVVAILYISSSLPRIGQTAQDVTMEGMDSMGDLEDMEINMESMLVTVRSPIKMFYHDVEPKLAEKAASMLKTESMGCFLSPCTYAAYMDIPSTYLVCEDDQCVPAAKQRQMVQNCNEKAGAKIKLESVKTSHSPWLSQPEWVEKLIRRIAGEAGV